MKIGQVEIIKCLEKHKEPISRSQIAKETNQDPVSVSHSIKRLLKSKEIKCIELNRIQSGKKLKLNRPFRRTRFYYT